ncbi:hypothetical protein C1646_665069 [Rhizophagus diaphanus]|nr:hypothetical protein C1646_665069 [Rhizophagus diaphanus] [Rhizophagus sp. MUCL 43196]
MPDVHALWNSSTLGEEKKMGSSPSNKYSTNTFRRKTKASSRVPPKKLRDSTGEELDKVINYTLFLVDKYEKIKDDFRLLKQQYYSITNENAQLRDELEQSIISSKKLSKEVKQLLTDAENVSNREQQIVFNKQHIQSLTVELERLKSQYIVVQTTAAQHEANLISSKKEVEVLSSRLKELESVLSEKMAEMHNLESKLASKSLELQKCEAELSSKSFEIQAIKTECDVYKQHVSDIAEQSSIKKYQMQSPFPEKQNKETIGGGVTELSFLCTTSLKRNTIIIFSLLLLLIFWICRHKIVLLIRKIYHKGNSVSDTENGKSHAQINIPLKESRRH